MSNGGRTRTSLLLLRRLVPPVLVTLSALLHTDPAGLLLREYRGRASVPSMMMFLGLGGEWYALVATGDSGNVKSFSAGAPNSREYSAWMGAAWGGVLTVRSGVVGSAEEDPRHEGYGDRPLPLEGVLLPLLPLLVVAGESSSLASSAFTS